MAWDARTGGGSATRTWGSLEIALLDYVDTQIAGAGGGGSGSAVYWNALDHGINPGSANDQTAALAAMYAAAPAGTTVFFPRGTYIGKHAPGKSIRILGAGKAATLFQSPTSPGTNAIIVDFNSTYASCALERVTVDAQGNASVARGVSGGCPGSAVTVRSVVVKNCTQGAASATGGHLDPHGYGAAGIYCVYSGIVEDCEAIDCVYPIFMHYPDAATRVVGNKVWCASNRANCNQGISFVRWNGEPMSAIFAGSLCSGNYVANVGYDPQGDGQNGNGIHAEHCIGIKMLGNTVVDCEGAGIHPADRAYGTRVLANDVSYCGIDTAGGITVETSIDASLATPSGVEIIGNHVHHNSKYGIMPSWSAGTIVSHNDVHDNGWEGIWADCDRCSIDDNHVYDNVRLNAAPVPNSAPNVKAQIKVTAGVQCKIRGNQVFHTPGATKYAAYAIATNDSKHIVKDNILVGGWLTAGLYLASPTTNIHADNIAS